MRFAFDNPFPEVAPSPPGEGGADGRESALGNQVLRFEKLLSGEPVDLARISSEIRAHPEMEALATRLLVSLALSPPGSALRIEEAAVSLGTDRLRVLVYMWSLLQRKPPTASFWAAPSADSRGSKKQGGAPRNATPESLYLSSFVHWLGLDLKSQGPGVHRDPRLSHGLYAERIAGLTETLAHDFLSLLPFLELPAETSSDPKTTAR